MSRTIIISNRLPVHIVKENGTFILNRSNGGLATALNNLYLTDNGYWIGWPGYLPETEEEELYLTRLLTKERMIPVWLNAEQTDRFYNGFCNETIWPVFNYKPGKAIFSDLYFETYLEVQSLFAHALKNCYESGDRIWIHDYHLIPLASHLEIDEVSYFHHIHFPGPDLIALIPWHRQLLEMMMNGHFLCFQTKKDALNFKLACIQLTDAILLDDNLIFEQTIVPIGVAPISIDSSLFERMALAHPKAVKQDMTTIIAVDRLDYCKGLLERLDIFEYFMERHPEFHGKVVLQMIVAPSRENVPAYNRLKRAVDRKIGGINARFSDEKWHPVHYFYKAFSQEELVSFYVNAQICWISSIRDGINLVCKEFIACKTDDHGRVLLSKFAGVSQELKQAVVYHPLDVRGGYLNLLKVLTMNEEEEIKRMQSMRREVLNYTVYDWLEKVSKMEMEKSGKNRMRLDHSYGICLNIVRNFLDAGKRTLILDYDGFLFHEWSNEDYVPSQELLSLLSNLSQLPYTDLYIVSGRSQKDLHEWFGFLPVHLVGQYGYCYKKPHEAWKSCSSVTENELEKVYDFCCVFQNIASDAAVERKEAGICIHLETVPNSILEQHLKPFTTQLKHFIAHHGLPFYCICTDQYIEVIPKAVSKELFMKNHFDFGTDEFILCAADNEQDPSVFKSMPVQAHTMVIQPQHPTAARYSLPDYQSLLSLLSYLFEQFIFNSSYGKYV